MGTVDGERPANGQADGSEGGPEGEREANGSAPERPSDESAWGEEPPLETAQLALGDDEVRLPWLEADDDDEGEYRGYGTGQVATLVVFGLMALALIGGGIWWALSQRGNDVVADGSVIAAPDQPYKELPEDPGGKTFAGTGDTSFAVSEGQTRPARLDVADAPKTPAKVTEDVAQAAPQPAGVGVQVAAYSTRASAEAGWARLSTQYELLSGVSHRIVEGTADIGTVYRLQAVPGDAAAAQALCTKLKAEGLACQVKN
jgi:hypothetical protein